MLGLESVFEPQPSWGTEYLAWLVSAGLAYSPGAQTSAGFCAEIRVQTPSCHQITARDPVASVVLEHCLTPRDACCWLSGPTSLIHLPGTFLSVGVSPQDMVPTEDAGLCDDRCALLEPV